MYHWMYLRITVKLYTTSKLILIYNFNENLKDYWLIGMVLVSRSSAHGTEKASAETQISEDFA